MFARSSFGIGALQGGPHRVGDRATLARVSWALHVGEALADGGATRDAVCQPDDAHAVREPLCVDDRLHDFGARWRLWAAIIAGQHLPGLVRAGAVEQPAHLGDLGADEVFAVFTLRLREDAGGLLIHRPDHR